jgi:ABC-2 type transport system ATP-binding protein
MKRIDVCNVQKSIKGKSILQQADLCLEEGEICALVGPNGVGKTTLIKCILGLAFPDCGKICINGTELQDETRGEILSQIGGVLQYPESISHLTIDQLFEEHFCYLDLEPNSNWNAFLNRLGLCVSTEAKISSLSLGMKQRLLLALTLSHKPSILILDEPFNGLDIDGILLIKNIVKDLIKRGVSVLIASHSLPELDDFATKVVFMFDGKTREKKSVKEIGDTYEGGLREYYQQLKKGNVVE